MIKIQLEETEFDAAMRYRFLNANSKPLKPSDYSYLKKNEYLMFYSPNFDEEYSDPYELSLLIGNKAYEKGYFFSENSIDKLKDLGYEVILDSKSDQELRRKEEMKLKKLELLQQSLSDQIFFFIRDIGFLPTEEQIPEGEEVEDPYTTNSTTRMYGGGKWFVVGKEKIWAVRNNGSDGDCWAHNNVLTGGAGAIGSWIPYTEYIETKIRLITKPIEELTEEMLVFEAPELTEEQQKIIDDAKEEQKKSIIHSLSIKTKNELLNEYSILLSHKLIRKSWSKGEIINAIVMYQCS